MTKKPHVHAETIRAWADGESIQYRVAGGDRWVDCADPAWVADYDYRVKPAREYPLTGMTASDLRAIWHREQQGGVVPALFRVASDSIRHAIDAGQVVPIGEVQEVARNFADKLFADQFNKPGQLIAVKECKSCGGHQQTKMSLADRAARDLAVSMAVRDKCRDLTVKHAMRSGVVHDIERLDLFAIIDAVNG